MGYWQWVSVGIFVIPMVILWIIDGIITMIYNRVKNSNSPEFE